MDELVQWASASQRLAADGTVSPKGVTPKTSAPSLRSIKHSSSRGSLRHSPTRMQVLEENEERQTSPLRQESHADPTDQPAVFTGNPSATSTAFRLQDPPKSKRKTSGYFSPRKGVSVEDLRSNPPSTDPPVVQLTRARSTSSARSDTNSPLDHRSIHFAAISTPNNDALLELPSSSRPGTEDDEPRSRQGSFFKRLKSLASPTSPSHVRQQSSADMSNAAHASETSELHHNSDTHGGSDAEADIEDEETQARPRSKRRMMRWLDNGPSTAPSSPFNARFSQHAHDEGATNGDDHPRPSANTRRATMNDMAEEGRTHYSEDEGRERLSKRWKRGARALSSNNTRRHERSTSPEARPNPFRRLTEFASTNPSSPFRARSEKGDRNDKGSAGAQRWRQVKASLKLIGQRKKDPRVRVDYQKSAELMAELLAGAPAALFLASMYQRDEHGHKKIPALLEQLKVSIPGSSTREDKTGDRHLIFTINLEYGSGPSRMKWTIHRSLRDFANLHIKYKLQGQTEKIIQLKGDDKHRAKIPRFPRSAFPYLRGFRGLGDEDFEDEDAANDGPATEGEQSGTEPQSAKKRRQSSTGVARKASFHRRKPSTTSLRDGTNNPDQAGDNTTTYADRQRKKLEQYLQKMIRWLIFRPESTRLCKFLELSALAMRLSVEGGYHGKEGLLTITSKSTHAHSTLQAITSLPKRIVTIPSRHKAKWFMVRDSYVVAVDSPESLVPFEVFLVDSDFAIDNRKRRLRDSTVNDATPTRVSAQPTHHILKLYNAERKLRLLARNERQLAQFKESIDTMMHKTIWARPQRFESFAPVRKNVFARWLVDGRDHMWQVSRAIDNAKSVVYIHDWWLSPELYLRRPAAISQRWRLDRLLLDKAQQGVKIFVIVYRNIESAIPIDSEHTKVHLLELHPNICVQRSPNQFRQNQFFWAHHEKLVVVDNAMAFVGGVDLCFGRWDDPHHVLTDDKLTGFESEFPGPRNSQTCQLWPGKDYSNPRVQDFYALDQPYEEMYDRTKVPRMPWHDISVCMVGQPARDVARHFVQRWNYILRQRTPSRPTPVLLPPPDFEQEELDKMGMNGTCQVQILRSCTSWSIGTPNKTECSIMNAYEHLIRTSEHFIYIENQFFISSCTVEGTRVHNKIGDALVERIELAYDRGDNWRACIVIPLMPGFQNSVDSQDGTSVRLIMQCQYRSICRGETSIFGRLRARGIDPTKYIEFYALRQWGKIGPNQSLTTEQLYIHAKIMVVDDRAAIIGSANINERSMLGSRDSEVAAVIIDQETMPSYMGGNPYNVGVFPHTLRMRLMREHLGIDVDELYRDEDDAEGSESESTVMEPLDKPKDAASRGVSPLSPRLTEQNLAAEQKTKPNGDVRLSLDSLQAWIHKTGNELAGQTTKTTDLDGKDVKNKSFGEKLDMDVAGFGFDNANKLGIEGYTAGRESFVNTHGHEVLLAPADAYRPRSNSQKPAERAEAQPTMSPTPPWKLPRLSTAELGLTMLSQLPALPSTDDTDIGGPPLTRTISGTSAGVLQPLLASIRRPMVDDNCMRDPLSDSFYNDIWHRVAQNNTKLYRQVFRCMPDNEVRSWHEYREYNAYNDKFMQSQGLGQSMPKPSRDAPSSSGPPGAVGAEAVEKVVKATSKVSHAAESEKREGKDDELSEKNKSDLTPPNEELNEKTELQSPATNTTAAFPPLEQTKSPDPEKQGRRSRNITFNDDANEAPETTATQTQSDAGTGKRRRRATTRSSMRFTSIPEEVLVKEEAEELLKLVQGHLVVWPYDWLEKEERGGNWLYNIDQIAPLEIYD